MGITIEDVKEELISILTEIEITGGSMVTSKYKNELKMAIDTMSKYQTIQEIVEHYREKVRDKVTNENMEKILEVAEDGNGNM